MECHYELNEGCLTISMPKELDHHSAEQLRMEADLLIDSYRVRSLVFDFSGTEFMDSSGIGVLIGRHVHFKNLQIYQSFRWITHDNSSRLSRSSPLRQGLMVS